MRKPKTETKKSKIEKCQKYINFIKDLGFCVCDYCTYNYNCLRERNFLVNDWSCDTGHSAIKLCTDFVINKDVEILEDEETIF